MIKLKFVVLIIGLLLLVSSVAAQDVDVSVGEIPAGQQVTITYDATVNDDLPEGLRVIANQGVVTGSNINPILSDDPDTPQAADSTLTQVGFTLDVLELPNTGESQLWRNILLSLVIAVAGTLLIGGGMRLIGQRSN